MSINVWNYVAEYAAERNDIIDAVDTVFRSGRLILGESVAGFEAEFAAYCGARHGIGVDNGTNAVMLALMASGVRAGDDVITVSNTAAPTVIAATAMGARVRFVDIDPATYLMDVAQLESAITPATTCLLPVHLYGQCANMREVTRVARTHGLLVVEDCAQAHGATHRGAFAGSIAETSAFSFYPTKVLGAYGDGGLVLTQNDETEQALRRLRYYGMDDRYYVLGPGYNMRLDEVHAEILRRKLTRLDGYIDRRRAIARRYGEMLGGTDLILPIEGEHNRHVYYLYVVRHPRRDEVVERLAERQIHVNVSYRWPVHTMSGFAHLGYRAGSLPVTERAAGEIFSLPMYPSLTDAEQTRVCEQLLEVLAGLGSTHARTA